MGLWNFQTNFTRGELDPRLAGRIDIQAYYSGVRKAENVLCIPQGGIKRRPGTEFIGEALGADGKIKKFSFRVGIEYLLVFTDNKMQVYKEGSLVTNLNGSGLDYIVTPWGTDDLARMDYIQAADVALVVVKEEQPQQIIRTADNEWQVSPVVFKNIPQYDFNDSLSPAPVSEVQQITFSGVNEGDRYKLGLEDILTDDILFSSDDTTNENSIRDVLLALVNTANEGISVSTITSGSVYEITLSGASANDWDLITGTAVLTKDTAFQVQTARITAGSSRAEDVWSNARGWPATATFHESRLWFGGTQSRPTTLWGSNVNDFFNFKEGKARDDEAITVTLNTDQLNQIQAIFSNRSLQIFTTGQEFSVKQSPITPGNITVSAQTNFGSRKVRPVTIEGVTLYAQRTGKSVNQFVFVDAVQASQSTSATSLAPHLINNPVEMAVKQGSNESDANYVYILNDNGKLTVLNTLLSEDVQAFTEWTTAIYSGGEFGGIVSIAVVDDDLYMLVGRRINNDVIWCIEKESLTANTDSAVFGGLTGGLISGLDHLEGETVQVKADGSYMGEFVVSSGEVQINRTANNTEVGLGYTPTIQTMPFSIGLQDGPNYASKKKIKRVAVNFFESNGIIVNNQRIADKTIGQNQFDSPEPQTGIKRMSLSGWSLDASVTITQTTPFNMTVLSLGLEVAI